jgi:hypothetical protein
MSIRLHGGFETSDFWDAVRSRLSPLLEQAGYQDWDVSLQPVTAAARERGDLDDDDEWAVRFNAGQSDRSRRASG